MEGATSTVSNIGKGWVKKTLKRKAKKTSILPMDTQYKIQVWSSELLQPKNGFKLLFSPSARPSTNANSYEMEKILTDKQILKISNPALKKEVIEYFRHAKAHGYYPSDFELYEQPDGRIALLDFDKYGVINKEKKTVLFPFRGEIPLDHEPREAVLTISLSRQLKNIMKGGRKLFTRKRVD